ncbi:MAG: heavy metal translocating P-type ATPase [Azoarcus sp.]|jgi:heavy metal translocating P-type ATPase|nr:heavy metal translocating P-type ATPase [Azoarcus sp.]
MSSVSDSRFRSVSGSMFQTLDLAHQTAGRARFRYRLALGASLEAGHLRAIGALPGVLGTRLNPKARALIVQFEPSATRAEEIRKRLLALTAEDVPPMAARAANPSAAKAEGALPLWALAALLSMRQLPQSLKLPASLAVALPLFREATDDWRNRGMTSHVLEALAVGISLARKDYLAANTTTFMLALGERMEHSISRRSDELLKHLLRPLGNEVWVERGGEELAVAADAVEVGDTVIVGTGAIIPVDGTVLGGEALVNEAAMTGESVPVDKGRGQGVLSGTLVEEGRLRIYAEQVGAQTAVARIADYVEQSLSARSRTQLQAARLADRLVPSVLGLAGVAFLFSGDWQRAAAVLQADFSCALKLATPVAFKSSMYSAGQRGILVKGADALERLSEADTFIFDKTGTLTSGSLVVTDSVAFDASFTAEDLICLAASVEEHYFHPMAMAVVAAARETRNHHFEHAEVQFIVAHGVASVIDGRRIVVGSRHFIEEDEGISIQPYLEIVDALYGEGKTLLYIGYDGHLLGLLALRDTTRLEAAATIARLRELGARRVLMLTGDHKDRAAELAAELGIDEFHAELLPEDKAAIVQSLRDEGARVAFVGDGINDAPALVGAHVGIAMQKGADVARLTADIALLEDSIGRVADAKALANATMARIRSNYRLTVGTNVSILSAAALGLLSPLSAAVLHNGSTIAILLNAFRRHAVAKK